MARPTGGQSEASKCNSHIYFYRMAPGQLPLQASPGLSSSLSRPLRASPAPLPLHELATNTYEHELATNTYEHPPPGQTPTFIVQVSATTK